jgi:putative peptidoglycan lipid II flippase
VAGLGTSIVTVPDVSAELPGVPPAVHGATPAGTADQPLRKTVARVAPAGLLVQLLSFVSSVVLATQLGASVGTDAYYLALSIPVVVYGVLLSAVRLGGIPALTAIAREQPGRALSRAASELVTATTTVAVLLSAVLSAAMMVVLPAAAGGSAELSSLTREFVAELAPYAVTGALLGALGAVLAVRGKFVAGTMVLCFEPVAKSLLLLALSRPLGIQALVIGNLGGNLIAAGVLWELVRRQGIAVRPVGFCRSPMVRGVLLLSAPLVLGQALVQLNPLIDRTTAAAVGPGSVTVFELGVRLFNAPMALLASTLIAPLAATWSARLAAEGWSSVTASFARVAKVVVVVVLPFVVLGILARHDLVEFAYASHRYTPRSVERTANVLGALLVGMVAQIMIVPLSTMFVIRGDTVFPLKVGIANCVLNAALDVALRGPLGVVGIAASTSVTLVILCLVYAREARRRWGPLGLGRALRGPLCVSLGLCVAIAAVGELVIHTLPAAHSRLQALAAGAALAAVAVAVTGAVLLCTRSGRGWAASRRRS